MSGARLVLTLALELRRRGGGIGAAALCGGGGQGDALIIHVPAAERPVTASRVVSAARRMSRETSRRRTRRCAAAGTCRCWSSGPARATPGRWPG